MEKFSVRNLIELKAERPNELVLRCLCGEAGLSREIFSTAINRPGLALTGFFKQFGGDRIQIIGRGEYAYISENPREALSGNIGRLMDGPVPCFIFCYNLEPPGYFREAAEAAGIPTLVTPLDSSSLSIRLLRALDNVFAPQRIVHGVLVEVEGMGVLIQGESGIGKSEAALELLDRGHRLIADDSVRIKCLNGDVLWGYRVSDDLGCHMEVRGLGIIDVALVYGLNSLREKTQIELVISLEAWDNRKNYDRLGIFEETATLFNVNIPQVTIPVKPGRNIPVLIEAAVLNQRLKARGIHAAREFNLKLAGRSGSAGTVWETE